MTQEEQSEAIQKALDIACAVQVACEAAKKAYEEAMTNLEEAIDPAITLCNTGALRYVDLRGHVVKSIVQLAKEEQSEAIQKALRITCAVQEAYEAVKKAYEETVTNLEEVHRSGHHCAQ